MHTYATNSPAHPKLLAVIAFASLAVSGALSYFASAWGWAWIVGPPSALTVFGGFYWLLDNHIWRSRLLRHLLLVPDLNGVWDCEGVNTIKNGDEIHRPWSASVTICQSWSKIRVMLKTPRSTSTSDSASLYFEPGQGYRLVYHYHNAPDVSEKDLHQHFGLANLVFNEAKTEAKGGYFTGRDRLTVGTLALSRRKEAHGTP